MRPGRVGRRRGPAEWRAFSVGPPPNRACEFPGTRLSSVRSVIVVPHRASMVDVGVASLADDQGLAPACAHGRRPGWPGRLPLALEVLQSPDVVDLDRSPRLTE